MQLMSARLAAAVFLFPLTAAAAPLPETAADAPTYVVTVIMEDEGAVFARPRILLDEGGDATMAVDDRYRIDTAISRAVVADQPRITLAAKIYRPDGAEWTLVSSPRLVFVPTGTATFEAPVGDWDRVQLTVEATE